MKINYIKRKTAEGITEQLKVTDQIKWVHRMNNIRYIDYKQKFNLYISVEIPDHYMVGDFNYSSPFLQVSSS